MMSTGYCLGKEEMREAKAALLFARKLGLIEDGDLSGLERRRAARNAEIQEKLKGGEPVYGLISYSMPAYMQYELTRFKLDFTEETVGIKKNYKYRNISEREKRSFYRENMDLFTRYFGDVFSYEEVELIIVKRIREAEYDKNVKDLLCQLPYGE